MNVPEVALAPRNAREEFPHIRNPEVSPTAWRRAPRAEGGVSPTQPDESNTPWRDEKERSGQTPHAREGKETDCQRERRKFWGAEPRLDRTTAFALRIARLRSLLWRPLAHRDRRRSAIASPERSREFVRDPDPARRRYQASPSASVGSTMQTGSVMSRCGATAGGVARHFARCRIHAFAPSTAPSSSVGS